jgi:hypothetical protein
VEQQVYESYRETCITDRESRTAKGYSICDSIIAEELEKHI